MAIGANSYSSTEEVTAFVRHLLDGGAGFSPDSRPTLAEIERFIDRTSGVLNSALAAVGFTVPVTNATVKLALADWVTARAAAYVEMTQRGAGFSGDENSRAASLSNLHEDAMNYVKMMALGWKRIGAAVADPAHQGLTFTAFDKHSERADPDSTTLEQPKFRRGLFDA